jgi:thymidylate synthase
VSHFISAATPAEAWVRVMEHLLSVGGKCFNLVVSIASPANESKAFTRVVDALADDLKVISTMENANAIWPQALAPPNQPLAATMKRMREFAVPLIKEANHKHADSYVERLVAWRSRDAGDKVPQLERIIERMSSEKDNSGPKSSAYEVAIFSPGLDPGYMSFPCLSHLSFKLDTDRQQVHLAVLYRNHHFITHGYGNYIGLGRLLRYVAGQVGYDVGELLAVSTHADAELHRGKGRIKSRLAEAAQLLEASAPGNEPLAAVNVGGAAR